MYAVVSTGGKQYRVEPGTQLSVERLFVEPGASVTFDRVLLVADGDEVMIGTPIVDGASVSATVLGEERGPKLVIFKFKQKVKYRRRTGHRQNLTRVRIDRIDASGRSAVIEEQAAEPDASVKTEAAATAPEAPASKPKPARRSRAKVEVAPSSEEGPAADAAAADASGAANAEESPKPRRKRTASAASKAKE